MIKHNDNTHIYLKQTSKDVKGKNNYKKHMLIQWFLTNVSQNGKQCVVKSSIKKNFKIWQNDDVLCAKNGWEVLFHNMVIKAIFFVLKFTFIKWI